MTCDCGTSKHLWRPLTLRNCQREAVSRQLCSATAWVGCWRAGWEAGRELKRLGCMLRALAGWGVGRPGGTSGDWTGRHAGSTSMTANCWNCWNSLHKSVQFLFSFGTLFAGLCFVAVLCPEFLTPLNVVRSTDVTLYGTLLGECTSHSTNAACRCRKSITSKQLQNDPKCEGERVGLRVSTGCWIHMLFLRLQLQDESKGCVWPEPNML